MTPDQFSFYYNGDQYVGIDGFVASKTIRRVIHPTVEDGDGLLREGIEQFNTWMNSGLAQRNQVEAVNIATTAGNGIDLTNKAFSRIVTKQDELNLDDPLSKQVSGMLIANRASWFDQSGDVISQSAHDTKTYFSGFQIDKIENINNNGASVIGDITVTPRAINIQGEAESLQYRVTWMINEKAEWQYVRSENIAPKPTNS